MYGQVYKCDLHTAIRCFELLYKIYHALNLEYPIECKHIWLFLQEMVFCTSATSKCSTTAAAISDIKYHMEKNKENV